MEAYRKAPDVTAQRLFLENMENILAEVNIFIIEGEAGSGILQLLNLNEVGETPFTPQPPIQIGPSNSEQQTDSTTR